MCVKGQIRKGVAAVIGSIRKGKSEAIEHFMWLIKTEARKRLQEYYPPAK